MRFVYVALLAAAVLATLIRAEEPPVVTSLKAATDQVATVYQDNQRLLDQLSRAETDLAKAESLVTPVWYQGMSLESGKTYRFPDSPVPANFRVDANHVTFLGGGIYPKDGTSPAIENWGAFNKFIGVTCKVPTPSTKPGRRGVGDVFVDHGTNTTIDDCLFDDVDTGVRAAIGSVGLAVIHCRSASSIGGNFFYADGAQNFLVGLNQILGSKGEIPLRASPDSGKVSSDGAIVLNVIKNEHKGAKGCVDIRQGQRIVLAGNDVTTDWNGEAGTAISTGPPVDPSHPPVPGQEARDIWIIGNKTHKGHLEVRNSGQYVRVVDNDIDGLDGDVDVGIVVTGKSASLAGLAPLTCSEVLVRGNRGYYNKPPVKSLVKVTSPEAIAGWTETDNKGAAASTTQPVVQPVR